MGTPGEGAADLLGRPLASLTTSSSVSGKNDLQGAGEDACDPSSRPQFGASKLLKGWETFCIETHDQVKWQMTTGQLTRNPKSVVVEQLRATAFSNSINLCDVITRGQKFRF